MMNLLTRKLEQFGPLPESAKKHLDDVMKRGRRVGARQEIIREGDSSGDVRVILDGFACCYKLLRSGQRHTFACLVPGDFSAIDGHLLPATDHVLGTLSPCTVVDIPREQIAVMMRSPSLARAMRCATLVQMAILREWLVNLGQRNADRRIGHLFCEFHLRLEAVCRTNNGQFAFPLTQTELGSVMGLSTVHVNRVLQSLRAQGLIALQDGRLSILDVPRLRALSGFDSRYLSLTPTTSTKPAPEEAMFPSRTDVSSYMWSNSSTP